MKWLFCISFLFTALFSRAQDFSAYRKLYFEDGNFELPYRLLLPDDTSRPQPLLIFLHGAFEKGTDNVRQLDIGSRFFQRDSIRSNYAAYVLFPQCPPDDLWAYFENQIDFTTGYAKDWNFPFRKDPTPVTAALKKLIDRLKGSGKIDTSRIYIGGLSQGGMGVLDMIARYPSVFAGAISMCGAGEPSTARLFAGKTALWLFHGDKDPVVPPAFSREYYRRLKRLNANVRYTEYRDVEHNCWTNAFAEPELMHWWFAQKKALVK